MLGQLWYDDGVESKGQVVKAMAMIRRRHDAEPLVSEDVNPSGELLHRPLGGHVEFGEYASAAPSPLPGASQIPVRWRSRSRRSPSRAHNSPAPPHGR